MKELHLQTSYSSAEQGQALFLRLQGTKYGDISEQLGIPENTLRKWFAPSVNRHNLSALKDEQLQELTETSKKLLQANVVAITEKLTEMAMEGDIRAMIEVLDRVHGTPAKQEASNPKGTKGNKITFANFSDEKDIEKVTGIEVTIVDSHSSQES